ncbi:MAG: hypothetical protein A2887_06800 [Alphaproteobacteria bacterium RIFCSPLOWO2_01_FULL_40_26]|nr:MAG: hypothetical protein A3D15_06490 [Alphaproteobacteria bacterium RIFCSPHIGHO2_02_FULL_40_34]OFW87691.1 MAG: hypothetical protein A2794_01220 [Alphaproteobacteria bacterium RIFCSPHIGHO2_01_FULL_40_8]OFW95414.1 MAG: hypothetical protein A2887_06800 [Alphaproteobacteria bacterium RIFCSPLOWO2_01_FULL_40_26]OFX10053.1 MAG: hypothetical protein A3H30_04515 [Alphaproteobacteria bacterium RIFCSPLOWO2_02_FULL_40_19]OFX11687.1 MAG: hypothetical protein A3G22_04110 [Alphaproteobacteria bacterium RI
MKASKIQKITVHIPRELLQKAMGRKHKSITDTVKEGLEYLARAQTYENIRQMRGKVKFSIDFDKLRNDEI